MSGYNETLNVAIDHLQEALDGAREMPPWGVVFIVLVSLLTAIVLMHVMAVIFFSPCLYGLYRHHKLRHDREKSKSALLEEQDTPDDEILDAPSDSADEKGGK